MSEERDRPAADGAPSDGPPASAAGARIAVVIPCFNDGRLACEAAASVRERDDVEVLVVDDGSSEPETAQALAELAASGVRVLRQENAGLSAARMAGVRATDARYVYDLDADDLAVARTLGAMADLLDAYPQAALCYGDYVEFGDTELTRAVPDRLDPYRIAYTNEYPVTALFRRSTLLATGGWQHVGAGYEDWRLWMTLAEGGHKALYAGAGLITFRRRLHGERMLSAAKSDHRRLYRALRREHPSLFAQIGAHRRASSLSPLRKLLYPLVYGGRRRFRFERRIKSWLDRGGVWTLRR